MSSHVETLRNGFPGPRVAGVAMIAAPLFMIAAALCLYVFEWGTSADSFARISQEPLRAEIGVNLFMAGWACMLVAAFAFARLVAAKRPTLATVGGLLVVGGICMSLFFGGITTFENALASHPNRVVALEMNELVAPPVVVLLLLPGVIVGWITLAIGAWKAGVLGPARAIALAGTAGLPIGPILGVAIVLPFVFVANAIALVPLGVALLRAKPAASARPSGQSHA